MRIACLRFVFCLALFCSSITDGAAAEKPAQVLTDTSRVSLRQFDRAALDAYKSDSDFQYREEVLARERTLWQRIKAWLWEQFSRMLKTASDNPFVRNLLLVAGAALLIYLVLKIIGTDRLFGKRKATTVMSYDVLNEDIHQIDYEQEIARLVTAGKYRLAVRMLYLRSLKQLADAGRINWEPGKTNSAYLNELRSADLRNPFSLITRQFDYIWYGDFPVDGESFEPIRTSFEDFNRLVR